MAIPFTKMHGVGNDYIFIDCMSDKTKIKNPAELARQMSPPHFGIGADGIVLILPSSEADARMRMFNADGSEGKMCGNALRCIGRFLYERGYTRKTSLVIETASGIRRLWLKLKGGRFVSALADMGRASFLAADVPVLAAPDREGYITIGGLLGGSCRATCISMGNPHAVFFTDDPEKTDLAGIGAALANHPLFPEGVNAEFARVAGGEIYMRVWERGTGETLACGTGACASAAAAVHHCLLPYDTPIKIHMRGGDFEATVKKNFRVLLSGTAETVFDGTFYDTEDKL